MALQNLRIAQTIGDVESCPFFCANAPRNACPLAAGLGLLFRGRRTRKYCDGAPPYACAAAPRLREAFPAPRPSRGASWDMQMYVDARTGEDGSSAAVVG